MKSSSKKRRILPCPYTKQDSKPKCKFKYDQACNLLQAIELSGRELLSKTCLGKYTFLSYDVDKKLIYN